uniref:THAP domain-containing protein 1-like n=1 Tax=Diabrotica virgifera virgifera TaxID=50390 RepID=A0A6P7HHF7_DIAVI
MRCAVCTCNSDNQSKKNPCDKSVKFYRFPKDSSLCKQWLHATKRRDKVNVKTAVICSKHFLESDYDPNLRHKLLSYAPKNYHGLKDDAVPTQNLPLSQVCFDNLN